jgi:hypothetical protein
MNVYSFASGILLFVIFFAGFSTDPAIALFAALGVAEAMTFGQRLVTSRKASTEGYRRTTPTRSLAANSENTGDPLLKI